MQVLCAGAPLSSIGSSQSNSSLKNCGKAFANVAKKVALVALPLLIGVGVGAAMLFAGLPLVMAVSVGAGAAGLGLLIVAIVSAIKKGKAQASQQSQVEPQCPASIPASQLEERAQSSESSDNSSPESDLGLRRLFEEDGSLCSGGYYTAQENLNPYDVPCKDPHYKVPNNKPYYDAPKKAVRFAGSVCSHAADLARSPWGLVGTVINWLLGKR